jgi:phosphoribosylglycinamide formyltransferase-1
VDEIYDHGSIIAQRAIKISDNDNQETLQKKVLKIEHELFPYAIKLLESKKYKIVGKKVEFQ